MKDLLISFVLALIVGAALNGISGGAGGGAKLQDNAAQTTAQSTGSLAAAGSVAELSAAAFPTEVLEAPVPVLVDFYATWCAPCQQMAPIIEKIAASYTGKLKVFRIDVDANPALAAKYNVNSLPTFIIFKGGTRVEAFTGTMPAESLSAAVARQLN